MSPLIIVSIVLNAIASIGIALQYPEYQARIVVVLGYFVALSIAGAIMIASGSKKQGAIMVTIGCIVFVPIGLIGVFGAKKVLDAVKRDEFAKNSPPQKISLLLKISPFLMLGIAVILFFMVTVTSTTLRKAAHDGGTWVVKVKLQTGASPEEIQDALYDALSWYGGGNAVPILLAHGANANAKDPRDSGRTPLMIANFWDYTTQLLIERGADVNATDDQGSTALMGARTEVARILIERGAEVNAANKEGSTALMQLVYPGYCRHERYDDHIALLLDRGAKINIKDKDGNTALLYALGGGSKWPGCLTSEAVDDISLLISRGADVNIKNKHGVTPLMLAKDVQATIEDQERLQKMLKKAGAKK